MPWVQLQVLSPSLRGCLCKFNSPTVFAGDQTVVHYVGVYPCRGRKNRLSLPTTVIWSWKPNETLLFRAVIIPASHLFLLYPRGAISHQPSQHPPSQCLMPQPSMSWCQDIQSSVTAMYHLHHHYPSIYLEGLPRMGESTLFFATTNSWEMDIYVIKRSLQ